MRTVGALLVTVLYFFVTAAAFASEGYQIYFTNDYLMMAGRLAGSSTIMELAAALRSDAIEVSRSRKAAASSRADASSVVSMSWINATPTACHSAGSTA